jgi:purine-binding chemotaxis protein CheW
MNHNADPAPASTVLSVAAQILHDRAQMLASPPEQAPTADTQIEVLEFRLAQERYAVETCHVSEVYPLKDLTPLPCTPPFVLGVVNVRGRILPVLDLKRFFNLPETGVTDLHCIVLVRERDLEFGLLADVIVGVRSVPVTNLQSSLPTLTGIRGDYLKGVTHECLVVLDLGRLCADPKILVHEDVEN